ncbi:hypothetical protein RM96_21055 [Cupriavidus sp. IDO]|nr:hypothetical protein RM96_21055 [Cupriavidus sp. IDO]
MLCAKAEFIRKNVNSEVDFNAGVMRIAAQVQERDLMIAFVNRLAMVRATETLSFPPPSARSVPSGKIVCKCGNFSIASVLKFPLASLPIS